ncbi:Phenylacetic acid catabolic protein [Nocardioides endophyticus]|uniref:Phenylacetic acid catabolic protein n=1 Tax=Nocardioides endophyticus TaxID=1353775 RepID=UPI0031EA2A44
MADTKLVLGNWFAECVMNGRSLPDFAAMLGMCTASYGQTRAIYQHLSPGRDAYAQMERGRGPDAISSMELLDVPPQNWEDLVLTAYLSEQATWAMMSSLLDDPDRAVSAIARKVGEEAYFHLKYATGWFQVIRSEDESSERLMEALARRLPLAVDWFGHPDGDTADVAEASTSERSRTQRFLRNVAQDLERVGLQLPDLSQPLDRGEWDSSRRRRSDLPDGLFEIIRFKDPVYAH